jgi:hypothetical protein
MFRKTTECTMAHALRIVTGKDLRERKGISWSRQHRNRKIAAGEFPPPDGRTTDHPNSPPFWFESTVDKYLRRRAAVTRSASRARPRDATHRTDR